VCVCRCVSVRVRACVVVVILFSSFISRIIENVRVCACVRACARAHARKRSLLFCFIFFLFSEVGVMGRGWGMRWGTSFVNQDMWCMYTCRPRCTRP